MMLFPWYLLETSQFYNSQIQLDFDIKVVVHLIINLKLFSALMAYLWGAH